MLGFGRMGLRVSLVTFGPGSGAGLGHHRPHLPQSPLSPGSGELRFFDEKGGLQERNEG